MASTEPRCRSSHRRASTWGRRAGGWMDVGRQDRLGRPVLRRRATGPATTAVAEAALRRMHSSGARLIGEPLQPPRVAQLRPQEGRPPRGL